MFFVGDSAGHCLPMTAEGIRTALYFGVACGRELAAVLDGRQDVGAALRRYARVLVGPPAAVRVHVRGAAVRAAAARGADELARAAVRPARRVVLGVPALPRHRAALCGAARAAVLLARRSRRPPEARRARRVRPTSAFRERDRPALGGSSVELCLATGRRTSTARPAAAAEPPASSRSELARALEPASLNARSSSPPGGRTRSLVGRAYQSPSAVAPARR